MADRDQSQEQAFTPIALRPEQIDVMESPYTENKGKENERTVISVALVMGSESLDYIGRGAWKRWQAIGEMLCAAGTPEGAERLKRVGTAIQKQCIINMGITNGTKQVKSLLG